MRAVVLVVCVALVSVLAGGCSNLPTTVPPQQAALFDDARFGAPTQRISADDVLAMSDEMRQYLKTEIAPRQHMAGRQAALVEALYRRGGLKLDYDASMTRTASEAFDARSGNCLSLVLMTAAFAREMGLRINYQSAVTDETWSRAGNLYFRSGHVNLTLGRRMIDMGSGKDNDELTIDFLPASELRGLRTRVIDEKTVVAMYMNNRAAETLVDGALGDAYWWARAAIVEDPQFTSAYNTLGVVYLRAGRYAQADRVLREVLQREPDNTRAMANLAIVMERAGRTAEATDLQRRLALLEQHPPFYYFDLGKAAMQRGDFEVARGLFAREVERADYQHEFHFWLGLANYRLGRVEEARRQLTLAMENSTTHSEHELYAAKLAWLQSQQQRHSAVQ